LIEQAQQLGIYDAVPRVDVLEKRPRFHVLLKKSEIVAVDDFDLYEALRTTMVPLAQKLALPSNTSIMPMIVFNGVHIS
jgi:hypothetical protein